MATIIKVSKYPLLMRIFHWLIAVIIFGLLCLGWYMTPYQEDKPIWNDFYYYHKSFGVLVFILISMRWVTRLRSTVPDLPSTFSRQDKKLAHIGHVALYLLMFFVPTMGYLMSSSYEYSDGVYLFSLFNIPEIFPKSELGFQLFNWAHVIGAYTLLGLVLLHIAAAIKHRFFDSEKGNDVLPRML